MKLAYNPTTAAALTAAPQNNDITFDLKGVAIYARGVKFKGTDTTYSVFKKHTSESNTGGSNGLVPVPSYTTTQTRYLREDGTWVVPSHYTTHLYIGAKDVASNAATTNGNTYIKVTDNSTIRNQYIIKGSGNTSVSSDASGNITINSPTTIPWGSVTGIPETFTPSSHNHSTSAINALTGYTKATSAAALSTSDTLNAALGKLELKADTAYLLVTKANDKDGTIENLVEILEVLNGIKDTDTILAIVGKYLPLSGGTLTSNGVALTIKRYTANPIIGFNGGAEGANERYGYLGFSGKDRPAYIDATGSSVYPLIHSGNIGSQSVASAAKLTTARAIWGQSFDGTANISGDMTGVGNITISATGNKDYFINFLYNSTPTYSWRLGYLGSGSGNANYFVIDSSKSSGGTWHRVLQLGNETLEAVFSGSVTAPSFIGALKGNADTATTASKVANTLTLTAGTFAATSYNGSAAVTVKIPTKVSHLTNDSGYLTSLPSHTHSYLPLSGGTLSSSSALILRAGSSTSWYLGRSNAMMKINSYSGYNAIASMKTTNGDWSIGVYSSDYMYFTYVTDTNFNAGSNTTSCLFIFRPNGTIGGKADDADKVDGYHIAVQSSAGSDPNTIYFVT